MKTHTNAIGQLSWPMLQFLDFVGLVMVLPFNACLCLIWWLCEVMSTLLPCPFVIVLITCLRVERKMPIKLLKCFRKKWMNLILKVETLISSSLIVHPTFRRQVKFCIKPFLWHIVFMVENMSCPSSSVIYQNWSHSRWENLNFLFLNWHHANSFFSPLF